LRVATCYLPQATKGEETRKGKDKGNRDENRTKIVGQLWNEPHEPKLEGKERNPVDVMEAECRVPRQEVDVFCQAGGMVVRGRRHGWLEFMGSMVHE